ncbi:hypothetical protein [Streptomyces sp. CBMA156]|uniref:hypothetical protein n=1 Tax=Streptomyces sp. CBMA156 TaxID=1930280 RepID=UPI0016618AE7|nr:hypothetical protein [Streptomyces sp. CBMA156]MBD0676208.1 hypothetical protein [Streptomyces sp. CBMA156]
MALARKGSRRIVVDGTEYRWRVRRQHWCCDYEGTTLGYAVQDARRPGTKLVVDTGRPTLRDPAAVPAQVVMPREVAAGIRAARAQGWTSRSDGSPLTLRLSAL